jgi:hypothetical protein
MVHIRDKAKRLKIIRDLDTSMSQYLRPGPLQRACAKIVDALCETMLLKGKVDFAKGKWVLICSSKLMEDIRRESRKRGLDYGGKPLEMRTLVGLDLPIEEDDNLDDGIFIVLDKTSRAGIAGAIHE